MKEISFEEAVKDYNQYLIIKNKKSSIRSISNRINNYILPYFKNKNIFELSAKDYLKWQMLIEQNNFKYSYKSTLHTCFVTFLNFCMKYYDLNKNIASIVGNFKNNDIDEIDPIWSIEEFNQFIKVVDNNIYKALFNLLYYTGLREGEALALTFNDLNNNTISINKTATRFFDKTGKRIFEKPKTKKSNRIISIDDELVKELNKLKEYYSIKYKSFSNNFFIFGGDKTIAPTTLTRKKNYYCDLANVKRIKIHGFRHSHAILLYLNNVPINEIKDRLGHSTISMTTDIYLKNLPLNEKNVLKTLNSLRLI